jgi:hypothetical protein
VGKGGASCAAAAGRNGTSREAERGAVHFEERGEAAEATGAPGADRSRTSAATGRAASATVGRGCERVRASEAPS